MVQINRKITNGTKSYHPIYVENIRANGAKKKTQKVTLARNINSEQQLLTTKLHTYIIQTTQKPLLTHLGNKSHQYIIN